MSFISKYGDGLGHTGCSFQISDLWSQASLSRPPCSRMIHGPTLLGFPGGKFLLPFEKSHKDLEVLLPRQGHSNQMYLDFGCADICSNISTRWVLGEAAPRRLGSGSRMGNYKSRMGTPRVHGGDGLLKSRNKDAVFKKLWGSRWEMPGSRHWVKVMFLGHASLRNHW